MSITGNPDDTPGGGPRKSGIAVADQMTALYSTVAILAALHERKASGQGQHIDMSLLDVQVASLTNLGNNYLATGSVPQRLGNRLTSVYPSDSFRCSDGDIMLIVGNDQQFQRLCAAMGLDGVACDERFSRNSDRLSHFAELEPLLQRAFLCKSVAECQALLDAAGVPAAPINTVEQVFADPQVLARGLVREIQRADGQKSRLIANPIRMSRSPLRDGQRPPCLGEHTHDIEHEWDTVVPTSHCPSTTNKGAS